MQIVCHPTARLTRRIGRLSPLSQNHLHPLQSVRALEELAQDLVMKWHVVSESVLVLPAVTHSVGGLWRIFMLSPKVSLPPCPWLTWHPDYDQFVLVGVRSPVADFNFRFFDWLTFLVLIFIVAGVRRNRSSWVVGSRRKEPVGWCPLPSSA